MNKNGSLRWVIFLAEGGGERVRRFIRGLLGYPRPKLAAIGEKDAFAPTMAPAAARLPAAA